MQVFSEIYLIAKIIMNAYIAVIQLYTKQLTIKMPPHHITLKTKRKQEKTRIKTKNTEFTEVILW